MTNDDTLEMHKLILSKDEVEAEATDTITSYLMDCAVKHANKLGRTNRLKVVHFDMKQDLFSKDYVFMFQCERYWK